MPTCIVMGGSIKVKTDYDEDKFTSEGSDFNLEWVFPAFKMQDWFVGWALAANRISLWKVLAARFPTGINWDFSKAMLRHVTWESGPYRIAGGDISARDVCMKKLSKASVYKFHKPQGGAEWLGHFPGELEHQVLSNIFPEEVSAKL